MKDINVPEGYKSTDLGVIPKDWEVNRLGDIAIISSGGTPSRSNLSYWNGDIPWITTTQINFNTIFSSEEFITKLGLNNSSAKMYDKNTLLMAMYGQGKTRGKVAILGIKATINQACASIQINRSNFNKYIFFYLSQKYEEIRQLSNTGNQENLNGNLIKSILLPLPPLPEQKAIARVLSDVDELIRECDLLIAKKRDIKQGTMQQLLTGKKRLPGFSGEWEMKTMKEVCSVNQGLQIAIEKRLKNYVPNSKKYITIQYLNQSKDIEYIKDYSLSVCCTEEDILMTRTGNTGIVISDVSGVFHNNFFKINFNKKLIERKFLIKYLSSDKLQKIILAKAGTSTIPDLNHNDFYSIPISLPTLSEQKAIAQILSDMDAEIESLEKKRDKYKAIKQGLMQELLTGKIRLIDN